MTASVAKPESRRRAPRKPVEGAFEATVASVPVTVIDISDGGLRLEVPSRQAQVIQTPTFRVSLPASGLSVMAEAVWKSFMRPEALTCGAVLAEADPGRTRAWRTVVHELR